MALFEHYLKQASSMKYLSGDIFSVSADNLRHHRKFNDAIESLMRQINLATPAMRQELYRKSVARSETLESRKEVNKQSDVSWDNN